MSTVRLFHATTRQNLPSIQANGLLVSKADATARIKGVWLHSASQRPWATLHTVRKHTAQLDDVVVLEVRVPRASLRRFKTGLWYSSTDIAATRIVNIISGATFGASASE